MADSGWGEGDMTKMSKISLLLTGVVFLLLTIGSAAVAHDKVVVVPLNSSKNKSFIPTTAQKKIIINQYNLFCTVRQIH